ncbi:hypothetical protein PpBr36_01862 [Pyricularia pennisetigena]|uniref:hypothetical protein n=1 Tax=Pyricularia pennisetigena TaxID=1578925 RepID=UPI00114F8635|nr:hypothetical protein PpBr36_01862 [Pyricularia pennisetigena]TLS28740.1 hypothetical protein PpBr36_01862 [Pyricularia pennisetigena]
MVAVTWDGGIEVVGGQGLTFSDLEGLDLAGGAWAAGRFAAAGTIPRARSTSLSDGLETNRSEGTSMPVFSLRVPRIWRLMSESIPKLAKSGAAMISSTSMPISVAMVLRMASWSSLVSAAAPLPSIFSPLTEAVSLPSAGVVTSDSESISPETEELLLELSSHAADPSNCARKALNAPMIHVLANATADSKRHQRVDTEIGEGNVVSKLVVTDTNLLGKNVKHLGDDRGELLVDLGDVLGCDTLALLLGGGSLGLLLDSRLGSGGSSADGGGDGGRSTRGQHHVEDLAGDGLELQVTAHANDLVAVEDVDVTSVDLVALDRLHADVAAVLLAGHGELREPERSPSVRDEDLLARVDGVGSVDDEARDVAQTVDPVRAEDVLAVGLGGLELDLSSSLASVAVKDNLLHTAVAGSVVDKGGKQLISQAAANLGRLAILLSLNETVNARLDEVGDAVKLALPVLGVTEVDLAVGMVNTLSTLAGVEDQFGAVLGSVGSDCEPQDVALSGVVKDEGLGDLHVGDVDANVLRLGTEQLVGILTSGDGHVSVQRRGAERSTVDQVAGNNTTKVLAGQVGLDLDDSNVTLDLLTDDLLDSGRLKLGLGDGSSRGEGLGDAVLAETPVSLVLQPVVLLVECIRGKVEVPDGREEVIVVLVPVDVQTSSVESAETGAQGLVSRLVAADSGHSDSRDTKGSLDHVGADGVGADLEPDSLLIDGAGRLGRNKATKEVNSVTSMIAQVLGVDGLIVNELAKEGRDDGNPGGVEADSASQLLKVIQDGVDLGRVEGEGHLELSALEASGTKLLRNLGHLGSLTTEDSLAGSVDACNVGRGGASSKSLLDSGNRPHDSKHGVGTGSALLNEKLGTSTNEVDGVAGRQNTGNVESSILAKAVAHDRSRLDAPRSPELSQSHLEAAKTKLDDEWLELGDIRLAAVNQRHEGREAVDLRNPVKLVDGLAEDGVVGIQLLAKTSVVGALTGEHEGNLGGLGRDGDKVLLQAGLEGLLSFAQVLGRHVHAPVVLNAASDGGIIVLVHPLDQPFGVVDHGRLGLAGDGDHVDIARVLSGRLDGRSILEQQTGVTTSSAEVVDEDPAGLAIRSLEWRQVESDVHVALTQILGEGLVDDGSLLNTDVGRDGVLLEHEQDLAQSSDTGGSLTVTQVGLHGTKVQGTVGGPLPVGRGKDVGDGDHLGSVTSLSTGTVHLDVVNIERVNTSLIQDGRRQKTVGVGDGDGIGRVVGGSAENDSQNTIMVGNGIIEPLDDDGGAAVTTAVSIGIVVEGGAGALLGKELSTTQTRKNIGVGHAGQTTHDCGVTVACPQRRAGNVHGSGTGRAGSVHVQTGAAESQVVVDPTRAKGSDTSRDEVCVNLLGGVDFTPVIRCLAVEGTDAVQPGRGCPVRHVTAHLESLVGGRQGHPLHGIGLEGFTRRHVEEARVEHARLLNPAAVRSVTGVGDLAIGVVVSLHRETIGRDDAVNVQPPGKKLPQLLVAGSIRETSGHTDDGQLITAAASMVSNGGFGALLGYLRSLAEGDLQIRLGLEEVGEGGRVLCGTKGDDEARLSVKTTSQI